MINITLPDGSIKQYDQQVSGLDIANSISPRLAAEVLAVSVNDEVIDLTRPITSDASVKLFKWDDKEGKHAFWHSSAHLMAEAIEALYPGTKFGIGPTIETGFYYDIDLPEGKVITDKELEAIEKKMLELARQKNDIVRSEISKADALKLFEEKGDQYKLELISDLEDGTITLYKQNLPTYAVAPHSQYRAHQSHQAVNCSWCLQRSNEKQNAYPHLRGYLPESKTTGRISPIA